MSPHKRCITILCVLSGTLLSSNALANEVLVHRPDLEIENTDLSINFSLVYFAQWAFYLASQNETINKNGSIENWFENTQRTRFDRDHFDYNIYKHSFAGAGYYLFYRSRGYTEVNSFGWAFISSLAFEYSVETLTEPPSVQDIYQTPVYGTLLGMGLERLSLYLHSQPSFSTRLLGYLLNPFTLLPFSSYEWIAAPTLTHNSIGAKLQINF